ncbi:MAG TPA: hypothetical protein VIS74_00995 [Chthoniobacterales bacterium]
MARAALFMFEKIFEGHSDIFCDLAHKKGGDISALVIRDSGLPSIGMFELAMGTFLSNQFKFEIAQYSHHLSRFENGNTAHDA